MSDATVVAPARLRWIDDQPTSRQFGDIYHSRDGAAEVERVFVAPQALTERMGRCRDVFTVGELGFGSGLNFAVIVQRMLECAPSSTRLHFISVDLFPFAARDFADVARRRSTTLPIYAELARVYPPLIGGWHRRHLAGGRITLSLFFGDALDAFDDIVDRQRRPIDAWVLDGFAPDRNPQMWRDALWRTLARLSGTDTTLATFTAVGDVRRGLAAAGFHMHKIDQRPFKRHTLAGTFTGPPSRRFEAPKTVAVVGAGIAGAMTARQLAQRDVRVRIVDAATAPPNRIAPTLLHCRLLGDHDPASRLRAHAYLYSLHRYVEPTASLRPARDDARAGVLQFTGGTFDECRLEQIANAFEPTGDWLSRVDPRTAAAIAGTPIARSGLFFRHGRAIDLAAECAAAIRAAGCTLPIKARVTSIEIDAGGARVETNDGHFDADAIVLCTGASTNGFDVAQYLELAPIAGQIDFVRTRLQPRVPIVGEGFMVPAADGCAVGATYEHRPWDVERATNFNLERHARWTRALTGTSWPIEPSGHVRGVRAVSSDRLPIVGPLFDVQHNALPHVRVNVAHGSQGTLTAPFAAEWIAAALCGEFAPCTRAQEAAWSALRFRERQARRGSRRGAADATDRTPERSSRSRSDRSP